MADHFRCPEVGPCLVLDEYHGNERRGLALDVQDRLGDVRIALRKLDTVETADEGETRVLIDTAIVETYALRRTLEALLGSILDPEACNCGGVGFGQHLTTCPIAMADKVGTR